MGPILWEEWEEGEPSIVSPPTPLDCYTPLTDVTQARFDFLRFDKLGF